MMKLIWTFGWAAVAVWSLFAFAAYGLVDLFGGLAARHADVVPGQPETVEWLSGFFLTLRNLGTTLILLVWGFVSLCILSVPWMLSRIVTVAPRAGDGPFVARRTDGVIDLPSDQYAVVEPGAAKPARSDRVIGRG